MYGFMKIKAIINSQLKFIRLLKFFNNVDKFAIQVVTQILKFIFNNSMQKLNLKGEYNL